MVFDIVLAFTTKNKILLWILVRKLSIIKRDTNEKSSNQTHMIHRETENKIDINIE